MIRCLALVLLLVAAPGCGHGLISRDAIHAHMLHPRSMICIDGLPVRLIVAPGCVEGICGYTCEPGRWEK